MKVLHVHDYFAPGNSRFGFDMDRFLRARGHEVHVLAGVGERGPADGAEVEGIAFHTYPYRGDLSSRGRYRHAKRLNSERFQTLQERVRFDVVVLNQPLCATGILSSPAAMAVSKVYWFLSPWAAEWEAANPGAGAVSRWFQAGFRNRLEDGALRACEAILVESEYMERQLRARHPSVGRRKLSRVPGAVDLRRFAPNGTRESARARFGLGPGPVVLTVRRLVERMGIDLFLEAASRIPEAEVVVGGEGPLRKGLEGLARKLGLRARFLGYVPDEDLPALYRAADLFVLPTRALEGFGLVAIEAMACGTPAMGTPVGAIPEVLGPLDLVFRDATAEAMEEGIRGLLASSRREELAERCRAYVAERFDWAKVIERAEEALLEACGAGRPRCRRGDGR